MIVDVYNTVQTIINKNHYGLLTATRFGYLAKNSQLRIYDELADEYRRSKIRLLRQAPEERIRSIEQALATVYTPYDLTKNVSTGEFALPSDVMNIDSVFVDNKVVDKVSWGKDKRLTRYTATAPTEDAPVYVNYGSYIKISPDTIGEIDGYAFQEVGMAYYKTPADPVIATSEQSGVEVVNPALVVDFTLPDTYFDKLVVYVLEQVGIKLREDMVAAFAGKKQVEEFQKDNS